MKAVAKIQRSQPEILPREPSLQTGAPGEAPLEQASLHPAESRPVTAVKSSNGPRVDLSTLFLAPDATIGQACVCIDRSGRLSLALIVDELGRLLNTVSDGDIRRSLLAGLQLSDSIPTLIAIKSKTPHPLPVTAAVGTDGGTLINLMRARGVRQIPIVTHDGRVVDIVTLDDLLPEEPRVLHAVVMAGGFGTRLRPLTETIPKPMLPIGGRPLMELIIDQLRETGVTKINIATHYQAHKIVEHFGDGSGFGVDISYVNERDPLGSGGALGLMERPDEPLLVINGDILTDIDFRAMHTYHQEHNSMMTVAVRHYEMQVPYGIVDCAGTYVQALQEKPHLAFFVNAGIYLLEPSVHQYVPANQHLNMTDLIQTLLREKQTVVSFPMREYWLDIGHHNDYERAQKDVETGKWRWTGAAQ